MGALEIQERQEILEIDHQGEDTLKETPLEVSQDQGGDPRPEEVDPPTEVIQLVEGDPPTEVTQLEEDPLTGVLLVSPCRKETEIVAAFMCDRKEVTMQNERDGIGCRWTRNRQKTS